MSIVASNKEKNSEFRRIMNKNSKLFADKKASRKWMDPEKKNKNLETINKTQNTNYKKMKHQQRGKEAGCHKYHVK